MGRGETSHRLEAIAHRPIASDLGLQAGTQQAGVLRLKGVFCVFCSCPGNQELVF